MIHALVLTATMILATPPHFAACESPTLPLSPISSFIKGTETGLQAGGLNCQFCTTSEYENCFDESWQACGCGIGSCTEQCVYGNLAICCAQICIFVETA